MLQVISAKGIMCFLQPLLRLLSFYLTFIILLLKQNSCLILYLLWDDWKCFSVNKAAGLH